VLKVPESMFFVLGVRLDQDFKKHVLHRITLKLDDYLRGGYKCDSS